MATPQEKLAGALELLHDLQKKGVIAIQTDIIPKGQRLLLLRKNFLKEVTKGWYIAINPMALPGDSTPWFSSFWEFTTQFLEHKYGTEWCISAEQSLQLHAGNLVVPTQLIVKSPKANNTLTPLPHQTSVFNLRAALPDASYLTVKNGIRMYGLAPSLIYCSENTYVNNATDVRTALSLIRDASELLYILLQNGHTTVAGRLIGAYRNMGRDRIANNIMSAMKTAGYEPREKDPFTSQLDSSLLGRERSPFINRTKLMWEQMRGTIVKLFPAAPGLPSDKNAYLETIDELYVTDAYHSLSIERYRVTPELIERVRSGMWDKANNEDDRKQRDAMAARGYWQAFQAVKETIVHILNGDNAGREADNDHPIWYRQLFDPSVVAGILKAQDLSGYRNHQVYIGGSKHVPLSVDAMRDVMPILFELLESETEASVRAVLGHFVFVYIHPYMDGNGRMGRFLMNVMLASGGYPWTVIPVEKRDVYMKALETASTDLDIMPFTTLISDLITESLRGRPVAVLP